MPPDSSELATSKPQTGHTSGVDRKTSVRERLQQQLGDQYRILRELALGGTARIFLATEVGLDRTVVLKVLPAELATGIDGERFRREIDLVARLQHPHLIPLLNAGTARAGAETGTADLAGTALSAAMPWFSMPWAEGETLRETIRPGQPLETVQALRILREIASALAYAHARGVVHRDIKPENVLLSGGVTMVSDFGFARALDKASETAVQNGKRITTVGQALGTPAYMAPEQVNASLLVDHKADIYAFGCLAYELFTGNPPFVKPTLRETLSAQVTEEPDDLGQKRPDLPVTLRNVIMQCLNKDPLKRPHSATVVIRTIDSLGSPTDASEPGNVRARESAAKATDSYDGSATTQSARQTRQGESATGRMRRVILVGIAVLAALAVYAALGALNSHLRLR